MNLILFDLLIIPVYPHERKVHLYIDDLLSASSSNLQELADCTLILCGCICMIGLISSGY